MLKNHSTGDTICAIATANAPAGIGIVRISGPTAIIIAKTLFLPKKPLDWSHLRGYTMTYGQIGQTGRAGNESIDETICLVFLSPRSYTGEDVVELQCHGGLLVLRRVLDAVLAAGARLAEPGEFTHRAFLNGRMDLSQAEAVMQLISAQSAQALRAARCAMGGALSRRIAELRAQLIAQSAHISAWADYPDEDILSVDTGELAQVVVQVQQNLRQLLSRAAADRVMISGVRTVLLGKPNVGKSSLMNRFAGYDRSIVTELPGTTRDTITESVPLGDLTLCLTDTAGLRETTHPAEQAGVVRSRDAMAAADLLLLVTDASRPLDEADRVILSQCDPARTILVRNKADLRDLQQTADFPWSVAVSAQTGQGMDVLAQAAQTLLGANHFSPEEALLANQRQTQCVAQASAALDEVLAALRDGFALDAVSICLEDAIQALFSLTGERATEAVVDEVFTHFCVGK
ncbi:MAG: tRNA uridine-5-carboxymethylaminomethyl(34) synthesis GTPase MnmE [Oscillospiraceae bacterium]|jgi:tRNA modification GTPase|nr:tRNA uridine-5-carboxymethylaminomethyl(34) synthesis GTPase MnmE [Oscillospiraceae bacterium]